MDRIKFVEDSLSKNLLDRLLNLLNNLSHISHEHGPLVVCKAPLKKFESLVITKLLRDGKNGINYEDSHVTFFFKCILFGKMYSRMDRVKFVEHSL